ERFFRISARTSVYALYCDWGNKKGWSTLVSRQRNKMTSLDREAKRIYGSEQAAFNRFERYRNEESSRFVSIPDREKTCRDGESPFLTLVKLSQSEMDRYVSRPAFGQL
ncbi:MAG: hypothetical protein AB7H97_17790, partial [Pseudobdellovibrionaceae bacterium]